MRQSAHSDSELVQMVLDGDLEAFDAIVRRYQDAVYATALHRAGNFADAQDIAQEVFLTAYINLPKLRDPSKLASWLRTITLYTYNHWRRKHPTMKMLDVNDAPSDPVVSYGSFQPDKAVERQELRQRVLAAIASLPKNMGEVVTLYYIDGLSYRDIAEFTSLSVTTVKGRLQMGRRYLREELTDMIDETLKQNRPDDRFSESLLEKIVQRARQAREDSAHDELLRACDEALEVMQHLEDTEPKKRMGMDILRWQAFELFRWLGKTEESAASWEEAAQLAGELDMKGKQAEWLLMVGITHWHNGQHAALKPYAQQAKAIYRKLDDLLGQGICDAIIDLCELLPSGWQRTEEWGRDIYSGYVAYVFPLIRSASALIWDWEEQPPTHWPRHYSISRKLRKGAYTSWKHLTIGRTAYPVKLIELPPKVGQAWEDKVTTPDEEVLLVQSTIASLTDVVVTPAGRFENCLRLESRIIEPEDADISDRLKVYNRRESTGLRILWFAQGIGLVKVHHEDENGHYFLHLLNDYTITEESSDYLPLHTGNSWNYQWYVDLEFGRSMFTERCRVASCHEDTWYLTSASYSDPITDNKTLLDYFEGLHQLEKDSGNLRGEVWIVNSLHYIYANLGDEDKARTLWENQKSLCTELEDEKLRYALLMRMVYEDPFYERGKARYEQALAVAHELGDKHRESQVLGSFARSALKQKDYRLAADTAKKAITISEEVEDGEELAMEVATLDVSQRLLQAPDADQSVGTSTYMLYLEGGDFELKWSGGVTALDIKNRIWPPSFRFLAPNPLPKETCEAGVSWASNSYEKTVKQQIIAVDVRVEVPAGVFVHCLLTEGQISHRVERRGNQDADMRGERERGFEEGTIRVWFARGHGIVQMDYHHRNGQRTLVQMTGNEIRKGDDSYFPIKPGNIWYYDWTNEKGEMLIHEMYRVLTKRGERTYIAGSAYAVHSDYAR